MKRAMLYLLLAVFVVGLAGTAQAQIDRFETKVFAAGTHVIPMDGKQNDRFKVFGLMHWLNRNSYTFFRILEPPNVTLGTTECAGCVYEGGPVLIEGAFPSSLPAEFSTVTVHHLAAAFASSTVTKSTTAPRILVIVNPDSDFGHIPQTLTRMSIPFIQRTVFEVEALLPDPTTYFLANFDLVVDDCAGWMGGIPVSVQNAIKAVVYRGGEAIFTDIALLDLEVMFSDYVSITWNGLRSTTNTLFDVNPQLETPGQYSGPNPLALTIPPYGYIGFIPSPEPPLYSQVRSIVDSSAFSSIDWTTEPHVQSFATAAFYFPFGRGVVEGFAFHIPDQQDTIQDISAQLLGNKVTHYNPPETPEPPTGCGRMTGGGDFKVCTTTSSTKSLKAKIDCGDSGKKKCYRLSFGFTLHCDPTELPNQLNITWEKGGHFKLENLTSAKCYDDPLLNPKNPKATWDSFEGEGTGTYKGQPGYTIKFTLKDGGEPGRKDFVDFLIFPTGGGEPIASISGMNLDNGNIQAHSWDCDNPPDCSKCTCKTSRSGTDCSSGGSTYCAKYCCN